MLQVTLDHQHTDTYGAEISFYNLQGSLLYTASLQPGDNTLYAPEQMPNGMYTYRIISGTSFTAGNLVLQR